MEENKKEYRHFNTTIMFIDMKGFTSRTSKSSREELKKILDEFENIVFPFVKKYNGKVIKGLGDAYLISFESPTDSVLCGLEIQKHIKQRNKEVSKKESFSARVGLSSGEVYERGCDIFGEPVNLASRIQGVAKGGQVALGESVYHAMNKNETSYTRMGKFKLKGIDHKVKIYEAHDKRNVSILIKTKSFFRRNKKKILILFLILLFITIINSNANKKTTEYDWKAESYSAIEQNNTRMMKILLKSYEKTPDKEKDFEDHLLAAKMYFISNNKEKALSIFKYLISESENNPKQMLDIYNTAREVEINLPEKNAILTKNQRL